MLGARAVVVAVLLLVVAGCSRAEDEPDDPATMAPASPTATASEPPESTEADLGWQSTGGGPEDRRIVGEQWTALLDDAGSSITVTGPTEHTIEADAGREIVEVLMDDEVVVSVTEATSGKQTTAVTVLDLEDGSTRTLTDPPPAGTAMTLHDGVLYYGTYDDAGAYCLAEAETDEDAGRLAPYCGQQGTGFAGVTATDSGVTLMTFDDQRPVSCRTLGWLTDTGLEPLPGVTACAGWDVAATPTGVVWSEVPRPRQQEVAQFRASRDGTVVDLGRGATGSLVSCGDSVFFTRDSRGRTPAQLLRWTADGELEVAYEAARPTPSFLIGPQCADDVLTLTVYAESGDEQVWASVD